MIAPITFTIAMTALLTNAETAPQSGASTGAGAGTPAPQSAAQSGASTGAGAGTPAPLGAAPAGTPAPPGAAPTLRTLSLDEAIELAVRHDPNIERARSDEERSRLRTLRANFDRVSATVDASIQELYVTPATVLGLSNATASLQAPLFSGWRVSANVA